MVSSFTAILFPFLIFLSVLLFSPLSAVPNQKASFLYIEGNTGESSGGHSALKLGETVYHLQYSFETQVFSVVREPWELFRFQYSVLENRNIHLANIPLRDKSFLFLKRKWDELYLVQKLHLEGVTKRGKEIQFLQNASLAQEKEQKSLSNAVGFGYFSVNSSRESDFENKDLVELSLRDWQLKADQFQWVPFERSNASFSKTQLQKRETSQLSRWEEIQKKIKIRQALLNGWKLIPEHWSELSNEPMFQLNPSDQTFLLDWGKSEFQTLIREIKDETKTADEELIQLLNYITAKESLTLFSFRFPNQKLEHSDSGWIDPEYPESVWQNKESEAIENFNKVKPLWQSNPTHTLRLLLFSQAETILSARQRDAHPVSISAQPNAIGSLPIPSLNREVFDGLPDYESSNLEQLAELRKLYPYHLIYENCTNELLRYTEDFAKANPELRSDLGQEISLKTLNFRFVPFVAYQAVLDHYKVAEVEEAPSYHNLIRKDNSSFQNEATYLSSVYEFNPYDSHFLMFTDDTLLLRPAFGLFNFTAGLGEFGTGFFTFPFSGTKRWRKGVKGMFFSLPEMVFFNVRKGSFPYVNAARLPLSYHNYPRAVK